MGGSLARLLLGALLMVLTGSADALAQTPTPAQTAPAGTRLRVFLDCDCFQEYLRDEIKWVDFVRQPQDADVHILSASNDTGGGGREILLRFVGGGRHQGVNQELRVISVNADTEDSRRRDMLRTVSVVLLGYMARNGLPGVV